jgi:hypothetical protein
MTRPHNLVHIVAGSQALHLHRVHRTLEAAKSGRTDLEVLRVSRDGMNFDGACARSDRHTGQGLRSGAGDLGGNLGRGFPGVRGDAISGELRPYGWRHSAIDRLLIVLP